MAIQLLVIARHDPPDEHDEAMAARIVEIPGQLLVRRCSRPEDLYDVVLAAVRAFHMPVRVLDLYDHGGNGHLTMGDPTSTFLFGPTATGHDLARRLSDLLTFDAQVRLLGCETALGEAGKAMLINLRAAFGKGIVVQGTLSVVDPQTDFHPRGFRADREDALLYSSSEAALLPDAQLPPTFDERYIQRIAWRKRIG